MNVEKQEQQVIEQPSVEQGWIMIDKRESNNRIVLLCLSKAMRGNNFNGKVIGSIDRDGYFIPKLYGERRYYPLNHFERTLLGAFKP